MPSSLQQFKKNAFAKPGLRAAYDELAEEFAFLDEIAQGMHRDWPDARSGRRANESELPTSRPTLTSSQ